jgi:hypothetical protein
MSAGPEPDDGGLGSIEPKSFRFDVQSVVPTGRTEHHPEDGASGRVIDGFGDRLFGWANDQSWIVENLEHSAGLARYPKLEGEVMLELRFPAPQRGVIRVWV